ncbi:MAG: hypothetical protein AAF962_09920 [Actinomycetota bacterium]
MAPTPTLHVSLTTTRLRRGVLLVAKHRRPIDEPLGAGLTAVATRQARAATVAEARWLLDARDDAVVAVRRVEPDRARLWTAHVATASLASAPLDGAAAAEVLAQVAATLTRLHRRGLVHGAVAAEHVLLRGGPTGTPRAVLCAPAALGVDGRPVEPAADLVGLIALAAEVAAATGRRRTLWTEAVAQLTTLAELAPGGEPGNEPGREPADASGAMRGATGWSGRTGWPGGSGWSGRTGLPGGSEADLGAAAAVLADLAGRLRRGPGGAEVAALARAAGVAWWNGLRPSV